jgi:transposase-like protein
MSTKFTPEVRATILEALKENPSIPSAATKAGIHTTTLRAWLEKGEMGAPEFAEFALECAEARTVMKNEIVAALFKTATDELHPQQTKAAHQLLTNLYPTEFNNVRHVVSHQAKPADDVDVSKLPTDELRAFLKTLKRIRAEEPRQPAAQLVDCIEVKSRGRR